MLAQKPIPWTGIFALQYNIGENRRFYCSIFFIIVGIRAALQIMAFAHPSEVFYQTIG